MAKDSGSSRVIRDVKLGPATTIRFDAEKYQAIAELAKDTERGFGAMVRRLTNEALQAREDKRRVAEEALRREAKHFLDTCTVDGEYLRDLFLQRYVSISGSQNFDTLGIRWSLSNGSDGLESPFEPVVTRVCMPSGIFPPARLGNRQMEDILRYFVVDHGRGFQRLALFGDQKLEGDPLLQLFDGLITEIATHGKTLGDWGSAQFDSEIRALGMEATSKTRRRLLLVSDATRSQILARPEKLQIIHCPGDSIQPLDITLVSHPLLDDDDPYGYLIPENFGSFEVLRPPVPEDTRRSTLRCEVRAPLCADFYLEIELFLWVRLRFFSPEQAYRINFSSILDQKSETTEK